MQDAFQSLLEITKTDLDFFLTFDFSFLFFSFEIAKCLLAIFKNINSIEKNVEKCAISVRLLPLSQQAAAAKAYDYDTTMVTKVMGKSDNGDEQVVQLFDTKFLIIMHCKHG